MYLEQHIALDFAVHGVTPRVYGKQNDYKSRYVRLSLFNQGTALAASDSWQFSLNYKTPSGKSGMYDKLPDDNVAFGVDTNGDIIISLAPQLFAEAGATACELTIVNPVGGVTTWTFLLIVEPSVQGGDPVPEDYYNSFLGIAADAAAEANRAASAADRAVSAANSIDADNLMQKSIYDPMGYVAEVGGIAAFVEITTNKLRFQSGTYIGDGTTTDKTLSFDFMPLIVFVSARVQRWPTVVFVRGITSALHRPDDSRYRAVYMSVDWRDRQIVWRAEIACTAHEYGGSIVQTELDDDDNLNASGLTYEWTAIGL